MFALKIPNIQIQVIVI